jgi:serine/threonine-protein kinase
MEYVEGETVADVLRRRGALPAEEAAEIAGQVAAGLAHAHAQGLVHRDVKPQNLLVSGDGRVKIADFGVARGDDLSKLTQAGTVLGTAAYLSPEQAAGSEVGPASDVYSLGVVLYELLTGRTPYRFDSLADLAAPRKPPPPPPALADVVARCLDTDSSERPSAAEVEGELLRSVAPVSEAPTVRIIRSRRRLLPAIATLVLGAAAIAVAVVLATRGGKSAPTPVTIRPVPHSADTAQQARNLAEWLRSYSR